MKTEIILVRHAEPLKMKMKFINSDLQKNNELIPLSGRGEKAAEELSQKKFFNDVSVVISSNYIRAIDTAKYIAEKNNCDFIVDNNLGERKMGTEIKTNDFWITQLFNSDAKTADGESQNEVRKRMLIVLEKVLKEYRGKRIVLVSHATAITFLLMNWCKLEDAELKSKRRKLSFDNKEVINDSFGMPEVFRLIFEDDKVVLIERVVGGVVMDFGTWGN